MSHPDRFGDADEYDDYHEGTRGRPPRKSNPALIIGLVLGGLMFGGLVCGGVMLWFGARVVQVEKENKADIAKIQAVSLSKSLKTYLIKNDNNPPRSIEDILLYVEGGDPAKLNDPWGQLFQIGQADNGKGTVTYYIFTTDPETGKQIRSDAKN